MSNYDDIINLPHPVSKKHPQMSLYDRAAQFSPFAALTGHDAAILETARLTGRKIEPGEDEIQKINEKLKFIKENLGHTPEVSITYFLPDDKKEGGMYVTYRGVIKKIDEYAHTLTGMDGTVISMEDILEIS